MRARAGSVLRLRSRGLLSLPAWRSSPRPRKRSAEGPGREPLRSSKEDARADARLKRLKWIAIIAPLAFLSVLHLLLHSVLGLFHDVPGVLFLFGWVAVGIAIFSFAVFRVIGGLEQRILAQNRQLSTVNEIAAASAENLELGELLAVTLDRVLEVVRAEAGVIFLAGPDSEQLIAAHRRGLSAGLTNLIQSQGLRTEPVDTNATAAGPPIVNLLASSQVREAARAEGVHHAVGVPLVAEGQVTAILAVGTKRERSFSPTQLKLLTSIGGQLGLAVRNAMLFADTTRRNQDLAALLAVGRAATSSVRLSELLAEALHAVIEVTSAETAEVWLAAESGELTLQRQEGLATETFRERTSLRPGEGLPGAAVKTGSLVVVHDLGSDPRFVRGKVKELGFQTYGALPLRYRGETVGVLAVAARDRESISSESELRLLEGIGERLAIAVENSRLHERVLDRAVLEERERIGRELHDGMAQVLGYINTQTLAIRKLLASGHADQAEEQTQAMEKAAKQVYTDVREAILGLRSPLAPRDGLIASLRKYLSDYSAMTELAPSLEVSDEAEALALPPSTEVQLMRIVQEALSNVRKHAGATAVTVSFEAVAERLIVKVADDGRGFTPDSSAHTGWPRFGLQTMRERAEAIGGSFEVDSHPDRGTTVIVDVPLRGPLGATV